MEFSSLDECIAYIEKASSSCMPQLADEIKKIIDEVTKSQVRGWTSQIFNSVVSSSSNESAEAGFEDTGAWYSLLTGEEVGNPIKFLEAGTTWNRNASTIMQESIGKCESEIPREYKSLMNSKGIPLR